MSLYENWIRAAYDKEGKSNKKFWEKYMPLEQKIYENLLAEKTPVISGKLSELAEKHGMTTEWFCGFLDGAKGGLAEELDTEQLEEDSEINVSLDFEKLYKKMVEFKAKHLYTLPQWANIFPEERRQELYDEQKKSGTYIRGEKPGRNDPCPCGSGKKYKKCCGAA